MVDIMGHVQSNLGNIPAFKMMGFGGGGGKTLSAKQLSELTQEQVDALSGDESVNLSVNQLRNYTANAQQSQASAEIDKYIKSMQDERAADRAYNLERDRQSTERTGQLYASQMEQAQGYARENQSLAHAQGLEQIDRINQADLERTNRLYQLGETAAGNQLRREAPHRRELDTRRYAHENWQGIQESNLRMLEGVQNMASNYLSGGMSYRRARG